MAINTQEQLHPFLSTNAEMNDPKPGIQTLNTNITKPIVSDTSTIDSEQCYRLSISLG